MVSQPNQIMNLLRILIDLLSIIIFKDFNLEWKHP